MTGTCQYFAGIPWVWLLSFSLAQLAMVVALFRIPTTGKQRDSEAPAEDLQWHPLTQSTLK